MTDRARTLIKICGLTSQEDATLAYEAGADWLGFILWDESPRGITVARAREITAALDGAVRVGVMVAVTPEVAEEMATKAGVDRVQLHNVDPLTWPESFPFPVCFACRVEEDGSLREALPASQHLVLLDTSDRVLPGGTGRVFPWETARIVAATREILLAGGLDAANVGEAIEHVQPFGVDASSKLESSPGRKDPSKVRAFVEAVRAGDKRLGAKP
jgi:phosphoribosylanthranilate isomerase